MPSDESELTDADVRAVVREELDTAVDHQRETLLTCLAFFTGVWGVLGLAFLYNVLLAIALALAIGLFGALGFWGQPSLATIRERTAEPAPTTDD